MHPFIPHDEGGESLFVVGQHVRRGPGKTWPPMRWGNALLAAGMLMILTATTAEAKKCKTLRLPSGQRFAACERVPRVISPNGDINLGSGWVSGGDRYSQRKGSGY